MDAAATSLRDEMDTMLSEIGEVNRRLGRLYDAIENGNIDYDVLKPRLLELKAQHDRLLARKVELELLLSQRRIVLASPEVVRQYAGDLRQFLDSSPLLEKKSFIKSFVRGIKITGNEGYITCAFSIPPDNLDEERLGVLPTVQRSGR